MTGKIVVIGTLDTKGREIGYVAELIESEGFVPLVIDVGILGTPTYDAAVKREEVAESAGTTLADIVDRQDKLGAIETMIRGAVTIVRELLDQHRMQGILAIGGAQGSTIGARVMQSLPFGLPKMIVSVIASGNNRFGPLTGTRDIAILHSVADILGLNRVTRSVLRQGVGALCGMIRIGSADGKSQKATVALTAAGVTTVGSMHVHEVLENEGFEVITFHCSGVAAKAMEELATEGRIDGIIDLSPHNLTDLLTGGEMAAEEDRLDFLSRISIPYLLVPGGIDFILGGALETVPAEWLKRPHFKHNPFHTHVRASYDESYAVGEFVGKHLMMSLRESRVLIPMRGFSQQNHEGGLFHDPRSDRGFIDGLGAALEKDSSRRPEIITEDSHINSPEFSRSVVEHFKDLLRTTD